MIQTEKDSKDRIIICMHKLIGSQMVKETLHEYVDKSLFADEIALVGSIKVVAKLPWNDVGEKI